MDKPRGAVDVLASLFPEFVRVAVWNSGHDVPPLFPEELDATANSIKRRRLEFARGRACARDALMQLGLGGGPIPVGPGHAPVWPRGAVGSITHCDGLIAAAAGREADVRGIGLDVEVGGVLDDNLIDSVCTPAEIAEIRTARPREAGVWCKMFFSAKESVYKAIYPQTSEWLDFLDIELSVDFAHCSFGVRPAKDRSSAITELGALSGRFQFLDGFVATGVTLPVHTGAGR